MADLTYLDHDGLCQMRRSQGKLACSCSPQCRCRACKERKQHWHCEDCFWSWPIPGRPPEGAECDNCGGELVREGY
jgi:hypothetical protein